MISFNVLTGSGETRKGAEGVRRESVDLSGKRTEWKRFTIFRAGTERFRLFFSRYCPPLRVSRHKKGEINTVDTLNSIVNAVNGILWDKNLLLFLLVGTGIFFTIRTNFVQVRKFRSAFGRVFGSLTLRGDKAGKEGMSSFQALTTAIAAQVGTGNIAGCATALVSGGPGAIFWMWVSAFFGMATIYGEAVLAQDTKTRDEQGHVTGGPVYYIRKSFKGGLGKFMAVFFSVAIILALGFMGNMVQSNSISEAFFTAFGIPKLVMGIICAVIAGLSLAASSFLLSISEIFRARSPRSSSARSTRRRSAARRPASRSAKPCASALPAASSPTRQAWAPRLTRTRWPRSMSRAIRARPRWSASLSTPSSSST